MASKRVLIVDDEEDILVPIVNYLNRKLSDVEISSALDGEKALQLLRSKPFDVVVTDIRMPKLDGLELLLKAREITPETRFIVMTAYGSPSIREKATRLGAVHYIEKPFELEDLYQKVKQLLDFEGGFTGSVAQLELTDIIQVVCLGRKSLTIEVKSQGRTGHIIIQDGDIVDARTGTLRGEDAFYEIVSWEKGEFRFLPPEKEVERTIEMRWENLLMEAMRIIDEKRKNAPQSPSDLSPEYEKLKKILASLRGKVEDVISNGIIKLDTGEIVVSDEIAEEDRLKEKVESYSKLLLSVAVFTEEVENDPLKEFFIVSENKAIILYKIGKNYAWGIRLSRADNLGKLKVIAEKLVREIEKQIS